MANEAQIRVKVEDPIDFTCADGTAITKGALLKLTSPRTAIISSAANDRLAGIAARDKVANDGRTQIAVYRRGIFAMYISGAASAGDAMSAPATNTYPNFVTSVANATCSGACIIGHILEDATNGQLKEVWVDVGAGGGQIS